MPRPRSLPRFLLSRLRALKPFQSANFQRLLRIRPGSRRCHTVMPGRGLVRDLLRRMMVAPAQLEPVDAHLGGGACRSAAP